MSEREIRTIGKVRCEASTFTPGRWYLYRESDGRYLGSAKMKGKRWEAIPTFANPFKMFDTLKECAEYALECWGDR